MNLVINGEAREVEPVATLLDLLRALRVDPAGVAVEVNQEVVPRARHAQQPIHDGDRVEIVSFVGGG